MPLRASWRRCRWLSGLVAGVAVVGALSGCRKKTAPDNAPSASASAAVTERRTLTPEQAQQVLARVGDRTITLGEYVAALERMDTFEQLRYQSVERRRLLLNEMIELELLAQEAQRRGLDKLPETQERLRQMLRDELLRDLRQKAPSPTEIPQAEVRQYYEDHRADFNEPERRRVAHIALPTEALAREVLAKAQKALAQPAPDREESRPLANKEWGKLVATYSVEKPSRALGTIPPDLAGDLGIVGPPGHPRGENPRVPEALRSAVFRIEKDGGLLPEVISSGGKYHVVRMTGRTEARQRRFEEAERTIRVALVQKIIAWREAELEKELRAKYPVTINREALSQARTPTPGAAPRVDGDTKTQ